ncbi:MFS transporter [Thermococcus profundus]|uniref:MFS transporter n=1 Tax=Thermococcus profundus TaxID=49899 RepID=UPI001E59EFA2|nr:MFS transporter [Thermococcus profundus]
MSSLSSATLGPYLSLWLKAIGLSFSEIGLVQSVSELTQLLTDFPTGGFADRYGRVKTYSAGSILFGLGLTTIALSDGLKPALLGAGLSGLGSALISGTMVPWLYDALGDRKAVKEVLGRIKELSGPVRFIGGFLSGYLASFAPNVPVLTAGLLSITSAVLAVLLLPDNRGKVELGYLGILRNGLSEVLRNRALHLLLASSFLLSFTARAFFTFWMILLEKRGLPTKYIGPLFALMLLSTSVGAVASRRLEATPSVLGALTALLGAEILLLGISSNLWAGIALLFAVEVTLGARGPLMSVLRNDFIPSGTRSTVNSTLSTTASAFMAIANFVVGSLAESFTLGWAYVLAGLLGLLSAFPILGLTFLKAPDEGENIHEKQRRMI